MPLKCPRTTPHLPVLVSLACLLLPSVGVDVSAQSPQAAASSSSLPALVERALAVSVSTRSPDAYRAAAEAYARILEEAATLDRDALSLDDQVDLDLLTAHVTTRRWEIADAKLHTTDPVSWLALGQTSGLFLRPGATGDAGLRRAVAEMRRLPPLLEEARRSLTSPARTWTENALVQVRYARLLLTEYVPQLTTDDAALRLALGSAASDALVAVEAYGAWLERELLPRSTREPTWRPEDIEVYQFTHEQLDDYGVDEMIRIARDEARQLTGEMQVLARQIHPSGDLRQVWELMKDEAPPWPHVVPMAQRYVDMAADWLRGPGGHVVTIPDYIDFGAVETPPMARRILSFGGASPGPTVAGRQSGYYVLSPIEDWISDDERASRLRSYNPYWTHVISYHEWLGHTVQIAARQANVTRPMRRGFRSIYFSQAWSFYLEKLLEDEGYYDVLPYMEALKTRMARRQMRMWRVQRILTKCLMARGEMTFDEAVQAYVDTIGMERANAFIEVQRDSQNPSPPGREIIGEREILRLREEYRQRMGTHYSLRRFHDTLLTYGDLPFRQIRRLMFQE